MPITPAIARAVGKDAADRNMRAAGRTSWNDEDWDVGAAVVARLLGETSA